MTEKEIIKKLWTIINDFAQHGTFHDTTPTLAYSKDALDSVTFLYGYMKDMDGFVKQRAKRCISEMKNEVEKVLSNEK